MNFPDWAPQDLIKLHSDECDKNVKESLFRLCSNPELEVVWHKLPKTFEVAMKLKAASIFYWQSQNLDSPSIHDSETKSIQKHIDAIQAAMRHTFGASNAKLFSDLTQYRNDLDVNAAKYKSFYSAPRQHLIWLLYRLTDEIFSSPSHDLVALLASAISNEFLAKSDVQPSYKKFKGRNLG